MNLFELFVKIGVKDEASKNIEGLSSKLGKGLKTAAKVGTAAVGAAAAGIVALTKAAVDNYAEYEQLVGGVETLFKNSANTVQQYAANAYKTAGLSANEYMSTVTSFSASLLQSLGGDTEAAAKYADMAVSDMSDNANKMGTSMEMIQNAYQGFAKQNYTMLDNLKLGYGGTKTEMERLVADAAKVDKSIDANSLSFGNIVKAINVVQKEMGIYGTTALEAEKTISGSVASTKSAWQNLITGIADDNADFEALIDNFVESAGTALDNILPRIEQSLNGASRLVRDLIPVIVQEIPVLIEENLPILAEAAISIIQSLVNGISENQEMLMTTAFETITYLATSLISMLPQIVQLGLDLIVSLANGIAESLPELIPTIIDVVLKIAETLTEPSTLVSLTKSALRMIIALAEGLVKALPNLLEQAPVIIQNLVNSLIEMLPEIIAFAITLIQVLTETLLTPKNIALLINSAIDIVEALIKGLAEMLPQIVLSGMDLVTGVIDGIKSMFSNLKDTGEDAFNSVKDGIKDKISDAKTWGKDLIDNFVSGITEKWTKLKESVKNLAQTVKDFLGFSEPKKGPLSNFHTYAPDMIDLFVKGLRENDYKIQDQLSDSLDFDGGYIGTFGGGYDNSYIGNNSVGRPINITQNIYAQKKSAAQLMQEARWQAQMGVLANA